MDDHPLLFQKNTQAPPHIPWLLQKPFHWFYSLLIPISPPLVNTPTPTHNPVHLMKIGREYTYTNEVKKQERKKYANICLMDLGCM